MKHGHVDKKFVVGPINTIRLEPATAVVKSGKSTVRPIDLKVRTMYHRTLAGWVLDLLNRPAELMWRGPDPIGDFHDRDWRRLYTGDILDD